MGYKVLTVMVIMLLASCEKIRYFSNVNLDMPFSREFTSPAFSPGLQIPAHGATYSLPTLAVVTGSGESINKMGLDTGQILAIRLKSFSQKICNAHQPDFDFVDSLHVYISAAGMPEVLMAEQNDVPDDVDSIMFNCTGQNLREYLLKDTVFLRLQAHFTGVPEPSTFRTNFKFCTTASLFKDK